MSFVDRVLGALGWSRQPPRATKRQYYAGAAVNRLTSTWTTNTVSADQEIKGDLVALRSRARDLSRNSGYATQFLGIMADNIVGPGIRLQPRAKTLAGELDRELNSTVEKAWSTWGHADTASLDGRWSWVDMQEQAARALPLDGEVLVRIYRGVRGNPFGFAVKLLDADFLDVQFNRAASRGRAEVRMGIEYDGQGRVSAYHLWDGHPNDYEFIAKGRTRSRVSAADVLHLFLAPRVGQSRGVTWFAPILVDLQMLRGFHEAALVQARAAAAQMGFISTDAESAPLSANGEAPGDDQSLEIEASPGLVRSLPPGSTFTPWAPASPNAEFSAFTKAILRGVAGGLRVSYNAIASDLESVNYSSMRAGTLADRDVYRRLQAFFVEHLHRRVFAEWLELAILKEQIPAAARALLAEGGVAWRPRGWTWVDPRADIAATVQAIDYGLESRSDVAASQGREIEEIFANLDAETQLAEEYDIEISGSSSSAPAAGFPPDSAPPPDDANPTPPPPPPAKGKGKAPVPAPPAPKRKD
jgi:lambda family phage portal protein